MACKFMFLDTHFYAVIICHALIVHSPELMLRAGVITKLTFF